MNALLLTSFDEIKVELFEKSLAPEIIKTISYFNVEYKKALVQNFYNNNLAHIPRRDVTMLLNEIQSNETQIELLITGLAKNNELQLTT